MRSAIVLLACLTSACGASAIAPTPPPFHLVPSPSHPALIAGQWSTLATVALINDSPTPIQVQTWASAVTDASGRLLASNAATVPSTEFPTLGNPVQPAAARAISLMNIWTTGSLDKITVTVTAAGSTQSTVVPIAQ